MLPGKVLEFRCSEIASETTFRPKQWPDDSGHMQTTDIHNEQLYQSYNGNTTHMRFHNKHKAQPYVFMYDS